MSESTPEDQKPNVGLTRGQNVLLEQFFQLWAWDYRFRDAMVATGMLKVNRSVEGHDDLQEERFGASPDQMIMAMMFWRQSQVKVDNIRQQAHREHTRRSAEVMREREIPLVKKFE